MKKIYFLLAILFFVSCGSGSDPIPVAKKYLDDVCERESKGYLKVTNFVKRDAIKEIRNGVDYYILNYDFELVGTKDGGYVSSGSDSTNKEITDIWSMNVRDAPRPVSSDFIVIGDAKEMQVKKGHRYRVSEVNRLDITGGFNMTLAKHEKGWVKVQDTDEFKTDEY